ncbi:MAG: Ig domain protein, partial [Pedosphaera sp.]|nr:Ig domain protein [Pedosphaera sp.]
MEPHPLCLNIRLRHFVQLILAAGFVLFLTAPFPAIAQYVTLTTLYGFTGGDDGSGLTGSLISGLDGNLYGATPDGGTNGHLGSIFKLSPDGKFTTIYSFASTNFGRISSIQSQGKDQAIYGNTMIGGTNGSPGTIFKFTLDGTLNTLYNSAGDSNTFLLGNLFEGNDGNVYGTTVLGGDYGGGSVFMLNQAGILTTLHSFPAKTNAA